MKGRNGRWGSAESFHSVFFSCCSLHHGDNGDVNGDDNGDVNGYDVCMMMAMF